MRPSYSFCLLITMFFLPASNMVAQDAYLTGLDIPRYTKAGVNYPITVRARNYSSTAYTFFQVNWRIDGGSINTMNQAVGSGGIVAGNYLEVTHPMQLNTAQGAHVLEVWITVAGDVDQGNDTLTVNFTALNNWAPKVVLIEARTETWCPQCPPANTATDILKQDPRYAVVKFHLSDGFEFDDAQIYYAQYDTSFTPAAMIELGEYGEYQVNPQSIQWPAQMASRAMGVSPVLLSMNSILNNSTRELSVTIDATFTYSMTGPFKFNVYLTQDHVPGPQANAPPNYIHHALMRAMLGGAEGTSGVIPNSPTVGITYSHTYTYTVPMEFQLEHLELVGLVEHAPGTDSRYSLNAISSANAPVGVEQLALNNTIMSVHPNPFENDLRVEVPGMMNNVQLQIHSIEGRLIAQRNMLLDENGRAELQLGDLPAGAYTVRITDGRSVATHRLVRGGH